MLSLTELEYNKTFGYNQNIYQTPDFKTITLSYSLDGKWKAQWYSNQDVLIDEVFIKQIDNRIVAKYAKEPAYQNCDGSIILPNSEYFSGKISSDDKIIGQSWACNNDKKISIPLELRILEEGNKLSGAWQDTYGFENKFIFTKILPDLSYSKDGYGNDDINSKKSMDSESLMDICVASGYSTATCKAAILDPAPASRICDQLAIAKVPCPAR